MTIANYSPHLDMRLSFIMTIANYNPNLDMGLSFIMTIDNYSPKLDMWLSFIRYVIINFIIVSRMVMSISLIFIWYVSW